MRRILSYMRPFKKRVSIALSTKAVGTIVELFIPMVLSFILDSVVPLRDIPMIVFWGGIMMLISLSACILNITANRMAVSIACDTTENIRHDLFVRISKLSQKQVDVYTIPSLESRLTNDTYNIIRMINMMQRLGIRAPILLVGGLIITVAFSPRLSLVILLLLPFIAITMYSISKKGTPLWDSVQKKSDTMVRKVRENATGIRVIKALSTSELEKERFQAIIQDLSKEEKKATITMGLSNPLINLILNIGIIGVVVVGAFLVNKGLCTTGIIIAFLSYISIILTAMMSLTNLFIIYTRAAASMNRIAKVLDTPYDLSIKPSENGGSNHFIEFKDVNFSYLGQKENLKNASFYLDRGQTLGIIGTTGSGKSTILKLLMRFYDIDNGSIKINGRDVSSLEESELRKLFGTVFQNDVIFNETIYNNIDFGRNLPRENIIKAARCAQAEDFISSLSEGYEHMLNQRGSNLSGGQKQRILIARALAAEPEILVLDDATSALDYKTDATFRSRLGQEYKDMTKIIVAQRVSSIMGADCILVLDGSRIVGIGKHDDLVSSCDMYKEICSSQLGGDFS